MTSNSRIDLFLASDLGRWAIETVHPEMVRQVITDDAVIRSLAAGRGFLVGNPKPGGAAISIHWPQILPKRIFSMYNRFWNVHPGYLPCGRGMYPVFWSVYLNEIAGASVHQITEMVDCGPIYFRERVTFEAWESAGEVWERVFGAEKALTLRALQALFKDDVPEPVIPNEVEGPNRTLGEFLALRDSPPRNISSAGLTRLKLAFTDARYSPPEWM